MLRKRWLIGSVLAALVVLGITGGVIMAQETTDSDSDSTKTSFAARVARILGLETSSVEDAMEQARKDMFSEQLDAKLAAMVEGGRITQAQADEYKTWIESRPEGAFGGHDGYGKFGKKGKHGFKGGFGHREGRGHHEGMNDSDSDGDSDGDSGSDGDSA